MSFEIQILSRDALVRLAKNPFPTGTFVISVTDTDAAPVRLVHSPEGLLRLSFDDVYSPDHEVYGGYFAEDGSEDDLALFCELFRPISDEQATQVARFVASNLPDISTLVCQCEFGQSRSAGIAAAVADLCGGDASAIFSDPRFGPNTVVFEKVRAALKQVLA